VKAEIIFWRIHRRHIPWAILRMAFDRRILKKSGAHFWKLLGTGSGKTFTPSDADLTRWSLLVVASEIPEMNHWRRRAIAEKRIQLKPISVHGLWAKQQPFAEIAPVVDWQGKVAALTRAKIKWQKNRIFWRSVPAVNQTLQIAPGLEKAVGIGEAPLGLQGTFSIWSDNQAVKSFAYRSEAHQNAIANTKKIGWYSEEMFARFAVIEESGKW
jgi:hypothetical protein